jgi:TPP-dependent pyruvate/acetoin dehydrogenase alpha subunit
MADLLAILRHAVRARLLDERLTQLARAGRIGFHPDARGFEPAVAASVLAMREADWIAPSARDHAAFLVRGMSVERYVAHAFGDAEDRLAGHAAPGHASARDLRIVPPSSLVSNHLTHAVGIAWAARLRKDPIAVLSLFGETAANAGDFHSAVNFAGVTRAPVVFLCRSDRRAPAPLPTPLESVADRAIAYGVESASCDAADPRSVAAAIQQALARALAGEGPTLVEAILEGDRDPLDALRDELVAAGEWDESRHFQLRRELMSEIEAAIARAVAAGPPPREAIFAHVYRDAAPHLERQRDVLLTSPSPPANANG